MIGQYLPNKNKKCYSTQIKKKGTKQGLTYPSLDLNVVYDRGSGIRVQFQC